LAARAGVPLERASAIDDGINRGATMVGAPVAGLLIASLGATTILWVDAASFAVSAVLVGALVRGTAAAAVAPVRSYAKDLSEGLRFTRRDKLLLAILYTMMFVNFIDTPLYSVVLPVLVKAEFGRPGVLGLLLGVFGACALVGTLVFAWLGPRLPRRRTFVLAFTGVALPFWVLAMTPSLPITVGAMALMGLCVAPVNPTLVTSIFERTPAELRGRVWALMLAGCYLAIPVGAFLCGLALESLGVETTLVIIASSYLLVLANLLANPAFRQLDRPGAPNR
jgi:predicted MFS family arabinose efflux permease